MGGGEAISMKILPEDSKMLHCGDDEESWSNEVFFLFHPWPSLQGVIKNDIAHIIVSRSHAGDVKTVATAAFGEKTEVIPAGGAGKDIFE